MNWSEFIAFILDHDLRISPQEAERLTGVRYQIIDRWKKGSVSKPQRNTIKRLEEGLGIKIDDRDPNNISYRKLSAPEKDTGFEGAMPIYDYPLLSEVYAGEPDQIDIEFTGVKERFTYHKKGHRCFALRVRGESMETTLKDGDVVLVDMDLVPLDGDLVAVKLRNGNQYIKRYKDLNYAFIQLSSDNSEYGVRLIDKNDIIAIFPVVQITLNIRNGDRAK